MIFRIKTLLSVLALFTFLIACEKEQADLESAGKYPGPREPGYNAGPESENVDEASSGTFSKSNDESSSGTVAATNAGITGGNQSADDVAKAITDRKIIRTGSLGFQTDDLEAMRQKIIARTKALGGYVSQDNEKKADTRVENEMIVRVPAQNFDKLVEDISAGVEHFDYKDIKANDVTADYLDLETRIKTKKELEQRYLELLAKATTVKDMLEIEHQIGNLRTEIERMEGNLKFMSDRIVLSTITIYFYNEAEKTVQDHSFTAAFKNGWENLVAFLLVLVNLWPFVLLVVLIGSFYFINRRRKVEV